MASGEMSSPQFGQFLISALASLRKRLAPGAVYFMCMDWRHMESKLMPSTNLVWN